MLILNVTKTTFKNLKTFIVLIFLFYQKLVSCTNKRLTKIKLYLLLKKSYL